MSGAFASEFGITALSNSKLVTLLYWDGSQGDLYSNAALDSCIKTFYKKATIQEGLEEYVKYYNTFVKDPTSAAVLPAPNSTQNRDRVRSNFWVRYVHPGTSLEYAFERAVAEQIIVSMIDRVSGWSKYTYGAYTNMLDYIKAIESASYSEKQEEELEDVVNVSGSQEFQRILQKVFNNDNVLVINFEKTIIGKAFDSSSLTSTDNGDLRSSERVSNMWRVFAPGDSGDSPAGNLTPDQLDKLFSRIESSGLLGLATYAVDIQSYAKQRFNLLAKDNMSQKELIDKRKGVDVQWHQQLLQVTQRISRDPILLGMINVYFPSLVKFYFEALAVVGDYSNNGFGGGTEDEINDPQAFIESLEAVFGTSDGKKIFTHAANFQNTSKKIEKVLKNSPYRPNNQPSAPDMFHLRLGAANFFVPPLSIDINTAFKTGSLTGGALRQKNTPKFNSGYKETSIRMRLFFPNYEEIWGITIDEASQIYITDNYEIDFKTGKTSDEKIDKFLSSLRGLVAAFKYSPFLPVRNHYLNSVHGITAVALSNISISTVPNFPFALAVDLELLNFNHKPFLPMLRDFNQAIHWGKYRQYMGKAAGAMHNYVNGQFLMKTTDKKVEDESIDNPKTNQSLGIPSSYEEYNGSETSTYSNEVFKTNVLSEWEDGKHLSFFVPAETQTKIFMPDATTFRTDQEKLMKDWGGNAFWEGLLKTLGIADVNQSASYGVTLNGVYSLMTDGIIPTRARVAVRDAIDILTAGMNSSSSKKLIHSYLATNFVQENKNLSQSEKDYILDLDDNSLNASTVQLTYYFFGKEFSDTTIAKMKSYIVKIGEKDKGKNYLDILVDKETKKRLGRSGKKIDTNSKEYKRIRNEVFGEIKNAFNVELYEKFYKSAAVQKLMESSWARSGSFLFREWEVPMNQVDLDPNSVVINGVTVTTGNSLAKLHLQMQDEPTYQHIGGKDTYVNISMTVTGEKELMKFKKVFDHITSLARLEHSTGVIGFMGIKNVITALCGIKYVIPLNYSVNTTPNYPHVYQVNLSLIDFDIFQQGREKISSQQQAELIEHFQTKKNPFLRIKQMWGTFNAYPDFPLQIKDENNEVVGHLDPDFYFRSFDIFDRDVIYNVSEPKGEIPYFMDDEEFDKLIERIQGDIPQDLRPENNAHASIIDLITRWMREYSLLSDLATKKKKIKSIIDELESKGIYKSTFLQILTALSKKKNLTDESYTKKSFSDQDRVKLITDYIEYTETGRKPDTEADFSNTVRSAPLQVGNVSSSNEQMFEIISNALAGEYNLDGENEISFDPDALNLHALISMMPIRDPQEPSKIPAIMNTAYGVNFGYIDTEKNGRFYLTVDGSNVQTNSSKKYKDKAKPMPVTDPSRPELGATKPTTFSTAKPFSEYQNSVSAGVNSGPESVNSGAKVPSVTGHWEKMLVDTQYRDISGRMIRAFPTYMLWLIDEGGYFAGYKMFDNFYGLQSIIDFSVISSEDLLGDTLVFRVSNLYSKLTRKESDKIFGPDDPAYSPDNPSLTDSLSAIVDSTLNKAKYILSHMKSEYVVDIENIRLKPGVRVHLRGGYGSNPNSLQTLFNGTITEVDAGEIITVTAQSDAIELGAIVNSTNKKGDTGKIDGGVNTGLWLSEPRDLMVRLLSMGTSRFREGIAYATDGLIFSENKFGIRHFGSILYETLNDAEAIRQQSRIESISNAHALVGSGQYSKIAGKTVDVAVDTTQQVLAAPTDLLGITGTNGFRSPVFSLMNEMWANFAGQRDLEIFKRNIYPGNGTGIAQFLGGDIGDGWTSVSSVTPENMPNERLEYLGRLTDSAWNSLLSANQEGNTEAKKVVEEVTMRSELNASGSAQVASKLATIGIGAALTAVGGPVTGTIGLGLGLTGVLMGRGGTNIWRTLGFVSPNDDDDMPGFDEVSFRAQTYMRTVWDLFQVCAKLLPNYIVAVRPFEDRSTVFYGKPHWLYTSGVVPVTTGYPGDTKAAELGISVPQSRKPDEELLLIISEINKQSSVYSDAESFVKNTQATDALTQIAGMQSSPTSIYAPAHALRGRVINLFSKYGQYVVDPTSSDQGTSGLPTTKKILAKLPVNKGAVAMGLHLPVGAESQIVNLETAEEVHQQIDQLPTRFRFPFFANRVNDEHYLENYSYRTFKFIRANIKEEDQLPGIAYESSTKEYSLLLNLEKDFIKSKIEAKSASKNFAKEITQNFFSFKDSINFSSDQNQNGSILSGEIVIKMPYPENSLNQDILYEDLPSQFDDRSIKLPEYQYAAIDYASEWGFPKTNVEEQFYIAMRWPYNPSSIKGNNEALSAFKKQYFSDSEELYGTAEDYNGVNGPHVLVYNPTGNNGKPIAVVCKPSYFLWGKTDNPSNRDSAPTVTGSVDDPNNVDAVVSPDAAYYLGLLTVSSGERNEGSSSDKNYLLEGIHESGYRYYPKVSECYFTFVPNEIPLGVAITDDITISSFVDPQNQGNQIIGFGTFQSIEGSKDKNVAQLNKQLNPSDPDLDSPLDYSNLIFSEYYTSSKLAQQDFTFGGNYKGYMQAVLSKDRSKLTKKDGYDILNKELETTGNKSGTGRVSFADVYSINDKIGIESRKLYDEDFDIAVSVIAGNGRTLTQARDIWDQFRFGYHDYESVKLIFFETYGINPEDDEEFSPELRQLIFSGKDDSPTNIFKKFNETSGSGLDEFAILLGTDVQQNQKAIDYVTKKFIDAPTQDGGLINYFNELIKDKLKNFYDNFLIENQDYLFDIINSSSPRNTTTNIVEKELSGQKTLNKEISEYIKTPKQLFLLMVGLFRQAMWQDPYARAWLVLKPNRKMTGSAEEGQWDFRPIDKIFAAYINPNQTYAKDKTKFIQLLYKNRGEGSSATNIVSKVVTGVDNFLDATIGPLITAAGDALSALVNMFKLNMLQTGYGLSQISHFARQANIMNKVLNDSIYYSLGRPGSLLRAIDNPFTREYGEPVVEIREPFQRIHYISSFSHILSNQIQENLAGVSTVVTAVSDGKYPVSVALDKGAPAERQVEMTVETGIYFDNITGSGFFGFLNPLLHPFETGRGISKNATGAPDELSAKRIALSHLKESIKDIYGGEIIVVGNADIRPHDLVYIADVYERMYGIFEVEQVIHHFTPELGYITSITPNALVTVNDPAKWYMSSWIHSWLSVQNMRNDTRVYLDALNAANTGISLSGSISVDALAESLSTQMTGAMQYTHGSSALIKDIVASATADSFPSITDQAREQAQKNGNNGSVATAAVVAGVVASSIPVMGQIVWKGWQWVRDNLMDQHGCYVQYLNKNGQAMDAGLSYNQGMVVGRYHSKALLPGILGSRVNTRSSDGYAYLRTDDLFKSLGWKETEIKGLVKYISYENALIHAQVLGMSGLGPEKAGLEPMFKVICELDTTQGQSNSGVIDADTIQVKDVFTGSSFRVRLDGINAFEKSEISNMYPIYSGLIKSYVIDSDKHIFITDDSASPKSNNLRAGELIEIENIVGLNGVYKIAYVENGLFIAIPKDTELNTPITSVNKSLYTFISAPEKASYTNDPNKVAIIPLGSPGGKATVFTANALKNKIFIVRIAKSRQRRQSSNRRRF